MTADQCVPLATAAQLQQGAFKNLVKDYPIADQEQAMIQATRDMEGMCARRLAPFTTTESHRAEGIDPDEYADSTNVPMDILGTLGQSYAASSGAGNLVRHAWLNEYAVRFPEYWSYSNVAISVVRSFGGTQNQIAVLDGPDPDSGHIWFQLGLYLPVGSRLHFAYSGGYTTVPADLVRANKYLAAAYVIDELDPLGNHGHDPDVLRVKAEDLLIPYMRG